MPKALRGDRAATRQAGTHLRLPPCTFRCIPGRAAMTVQRNKPKLEPIPDEVKAALVRYNNSILLSLLARKTFSSESESSAHPRITSDLANSTTSRIGPEIQQKQIQEEIDAAGAILNFETRKRLKQLCDYYQIDHGDFVSLALYLARDFIPNFDVYSMPKKKGRPSGRNIPVGAGLVLAVDRIDQERRKGIADACLALSKRDGPWKGILSQTLQTRYYESKKEIAASMARRSPNKS